MRRLLPVAASLALAGCAGLPPRAAAPVPIAAGQLGLAAAPLPPVAPDWWTALGDPQLDRLMAAALAHEPSLDAALARLAAARATLAETDSVDDPQGALDASLDRQRLSGRSTIPPPFAGSTRWIASAQAGLGWTLDLFGRQKALIAQAGAGADAAALDAAAARLAIVSGVASAYVDLARAYALADVARDLVASRDRSLALANTRIRTGLASDFDARAGETLLAEARQAQIRAEAGRTLAVHALAALVGRGADFYAQVGRPTLDANRLAALPQALPADLLGRRPDLLAARARIDAAVAGRTAARADFYPNVDLRALIGLSAIGIGNVFSTDARTYGGGAALHLPLFDGGRLRAAYAGADARVALAVADYDGAVLRAVREAADALAQVADTERDLAEQRRILAGLNATIRLDRTRVRTGLGSQLDVLETGTRVLSARQAEAGLVADAALRRVQLLIAVGGGFTPAAASPAVESSR
ncbi:efflux transporter outer membrane subunit [Sphingomonas profundi]|uniref:efflux transporter outer membrane subunit n=1 Tax=Alterirhizorhabdus profundi TaxID=2681549 RepID=UPI0012E86DCC|nr:efflux transporter outer membrane subunit [Sphingomonas profundi]